jgi:hypothetical protein
MVDAMGAGGGGEECFDGRPGEVHCWTRLNGPIGWEAGGISLVWVGVCVTGYGVIAAGVACEDGLLGWKPLLMIRLGKIDRDTLEQRQIQAVEPNHRSFAFMAVIVERPGRREDHVALFHVNLLTFHGGEASASFDNVAQGESDVFVSRRGFARVDHLQSGIQRVCRMRSLWTDL